MSRCELGCLGGGQPGPGFGLEAGPPHSLGLEHRRAPPHSQKMRRSGRIVVDLNAAEREVRGTYTLKLWAEEAGAGSVSLDGVTFP